MKVWLANQLKQQPGLWGCHPGRRYLRRPQIWVIVSIYSLHFLVLETGLRLGRRPKIPLSVRPFVALREFHDLCDWCRSNDILMVAYS
jgi:hypothetical protein